ncbi:inositol monophosphatase family protein [Leifsonia sp. AG29]|uniref:inositol monophosphatase family protein n=1 Tax=Leifsonia sp. AG29 TaxID=2598860 RepID=UPI00131D3DF6|nr:inositol monophosphatase family protein [Leifsonia sp. AG29]
MTSDAPSILPGIQDDELILGMASAARAVGTALAQSAPPRPPRDWEEFRASFAAVDDPAAEMLRGQLEKVSPGLDWIDGDTSEGRSGWFADVTDGAVQYLQGLPHWCVTVSLLDQGRVLATVLDAVERDQTFTSNGARAALNGRSISPSGKTDLGVCIVAVNHPPFAASQQGVPEKTGSTVTALLHEVGAVRGFGPTSWQIAETAAGRIDAFVQHGQDEENLLGAAALAQLAGALVTDVHGEPWHRGSDSILVAPPQLHPLLIDLLS